MQRSASVEINLDALTHNLSVVRQHANQAKIMAVIKANAYGHGMLQVARHLEEKVDALAVACVEEALVLRQAGIKSRLVILQGFHHQQHLVLCDKYQLEPVCHQYWQVEMLLAATLTQAINIWLKADTGMHRLGMSVDETQLACEHLSNHKNIQKIHLMSHFANADQVDHVLNVQQLESFNQLQATLKIESSLANSAAIVSMPEAIKDWVRPGIMLYGASPLANKSAVELGLKPVMKLSSRIIAFTELKAGEAIGYGSDWVCESDSHIAVIAIGYGDGYPRHAVSGTSVSIKEHCCPLVGRVSMDMICVDVTTIADQVNIGDTAVLWADSPSVDEVAASASTIAYELLCHTGKDQ